MTVTVLMTGSVIFGDLWSRAPQLRDTGACTLSLRQQLAERFAAGSLAALTMLRPSTGYSTCSLAYKPRLLKSPWCTC